VPWLSRPLSFRSSRYERRFPLNHILCIPASPILKAGSALPTALLRNLRFHTYYCFLPFCISCYPAHIRESDKVIKPSVSFRKFYHSIKHSDPSSPKIHFPSLRLRLT